MAIFAQSSDFPEQIATKPGFCFAQMHVNRLLQYRYRGTFKAVFRPLIPYIFAISDLVFSKPCANKAGNKNRTPAPHNAWLCSNLTAAGEPFPGEQTTRSSARVVAIPNVAE